MLSGLAGDCPGQRIILGRELIVCPIHFGDAIADLFLIIEGLLTRIPLRSAGLLAGPIKIVRNEREDRDARGCGKEPVPPKLELVIGIHNETSDGRPNNQLDLFVTNIELVALGIEVDLPQQQPPKKRDVMT